MTHMKVASHSETFSGSSAGFAGATLGGGSEGGRVPLRGGVGAYEEMETVIHQLLAEKG